MTRPLYATHAAQGELVMPAGYRCDDDMDLEVAEDAASWPRHCVVCWFEHGELVEAVNAAAAVDHRARQHAWLHAYLERRGDRS